MSQHDCNYRTSAKAIIFQDESKQKFLVCQEENGWWELPGGGIDHGEDIEQSVLREIHEEMGLRVTKFVPQPLAYVVWHEPPKGHRANVAYEVEVSDLNFTPSDECIDIRFVNLKELKAMDSVFENVLLVAEQIGS